MPRVAVPSWTPCLILALVAPALTSCGLLGLGGSDLDDALEVVPGDATQVTFVGREMLAERLELEDAGVDDYLEAIQEDPVAGTDLLAYAELLQDAPLNELDVVWSVEGVVGSDVFTVYRVDDDLDLDDVADALAEAGYAEDELAGRRHFTTDAGTFDPETQLVGGQFPPFFIDVTIDPDEHLVITGRAEPVLDTVDDERDSLSDTGRFDAVLDGSDDVELALLRAEIDCSTTLGSRADEEQLAAYAEETSGLARPVSTAFVLAGDELDATARLELEDDDVAESDLAARTTYLEDGLTARTRQPFSELGDAELERDDEVVSVTLDLREPRLGRELAEQQDGPFACSPE